MRPKKRTAWFEATTALGQPAELADTPAGRRAYVDYLAWLAEDDEEQKNQCFDRMSRGWAVGSKEFKKELLKNVPNPTAFGLDDVAEARELVWEKVLTDLKEKLVTDTAKNAAKSADWKVVLAAEMKRRTTATNRWIAAALEVGNAFTVSRLAAECRAGKRASKLSKKLATTEQIAKSKA